MAKINPTAPLVTAPSILAPSPALPKAEERSESQGAVSVSIKVRPSRPEKAATDSPEQLIASIFSGLSGDSAQALDAAGDLSPDRVRELLR